MKVVLQNVRLSFPDLHTPRQFKGEGKARYSASFLVEPGSENDKLIRKAILDTATEKWADKAAAKLKTLAGQNGKYCYMDGDSKEYDGYAGMMVLSAHRNDDQGKPKIVDRAKQDLGPESGKPYAGCYVNAVVDIWAQSGDYPGIRATLNVVQFFADGEPFAGSSPNVDDLPDIADTGEELADLVG